jgi:WD40 repeat protein
VFAVAFGSGATLATGSYDGTVRRWDAATGRPEGDPIVAANAVLDVAFTPDGSLLAAAGAGSAIQFWYAATGAPHGIPITGFTGWVDDIAFTPDGRTLAAADDEGLQLWDVDTGRTRGARLQDGTGSVGVAFAPDGTAVAAVGTDTTTVWSLDTRNLVSQACRVANRNLSQAEWDRFLGASAPHTQTCPQA